ncbi:tRNA (adenosine(37)-N6)-threonylcarbamoyltransferase complex dimerization subunit type 1 TsaB [Bradyrhizobium sp. NBAIM01]|uniref:tRNA (adenosine(37)-N6)-threonylcarbamoyltransferase complex dimerization subunit type 1 TsaB n=1 Tax=Bradyrhizobium sp. NBAIM01 TaxID=2793818 RepID=UPI001CD4CEEB|nr:tRNA (adenosine(37)-N6)-threonylcarbamoyltransferase complex dimerization subunit type 1 TsaB [Bradyrhizobium sp. NBAIM01]MCA1515222.1 tRNA (adenosine(37)-N6)-threonylcarbamoyltransferase complex dimerization subunit type 1 TsaB [Bradyrhizobium sp. NBAIM01]
MLILAIDTALEACAAAVLDTDAGELLARESQLMKRGHAEALMPMIARVMQSAGLSFTSLDRIAVTVGPGSFTGLRVGISAARGLALAAKQPAVGLTTLSAYAAGVVAKSGTAAVISAIDARHDHVYFQIVAGDGSQLVRPAVASIDAAIAASQFGAPHLVGNAAGILAGRWSKDGPQPIAVDAQPAPDISWVAWLGAAANPDTNPARPFYLKAPDAKPAASTPLAAQAATS